MKYSQQLIDEVKELYPNSPEMISNAEKGHEILGRYLDDSSSGGFHPDDILKASSLDELKQRATIMKRKIALYIKWGEEAYPKHMF